MRRALALAVLLAACGGAAEPGILLITLDTTRAGHLGCYGYERATTPNIDRLAAAAVVYERAYSTSSWTVPAHASLLTGKFPASHGARYDDEGPFRLSTAIEGPDEWDAFRARGLAQGEATLATVLKARGYATAAVVAGPWMKRVFGWDDGFDSYDDRNISELNGRPAADVTDAALAWLGDVRDAPFFLLLNYFDPHAPFRPPEELRGTYSGSQSDVDEALVALYDEEILAMDAQIGRLLDGMADMGLADDCWIVVTADHGELIGEGGRYGHGVMLSQEEIHVPLIVRPPGGDARRVATPVQLVDVLPTLLGALGAPLPDGVQGHPLDDVAHPIVAEVRPPAAFSDGGDWLALVEGDMKYAISSEGAEILVNVDDETRNLVAELPMRAAAMRARLDEFLGALPPPGPARPAADIDEETLRALEALGYVK